MNNPGLERAYLFLARLTWSNRSSIRSTKRRKTSGDGWVSRPQFFAQTPQVAHDGVNFPSHVHWLPRSFGGSKGVLYVLALALQSGKISPTKSSTSDGARRETANLPRTKPPHENQFVLRPLGRPLRVSMRCSS